MTTSEIYPVTQEKAGCNQYILIKHVKQLTDSRTTLSDDNVATYIEQGQYNKLKQQYRRVIRGIVRTCSCDGVGLLMCGHVDLFCGYSPHSDL